MREYTLLIEEGTHVMRREAKNSKATLVYPQAAALASMAGFLCLYCSDGVGGPSMPGLIGADAIVTLY